MKTVVMPVSKTRRDDKDNWYWYLRLGEQVLRNPLFRDLSIQGLGKNR